MDFHAPGSGSRALRHDPHGSRLQWKNSVDILDLMGFRIVKSDSSLLVSLDRAAVIRARLAADPRTAMLAVPWDDWIADWKKRYLEEIDHRIAVLTANAVATVLDEDLDGLAGETWNATEAYPVERAFFFGNKMRAEFVKPKLGSQYVAMGAWISHMASSQIVPLAEIGKRLGPKHKEATVAIETAQNADAAQREFRLTGARRQLVDRFNALGKKTEGELKEMPHAHPELGLPNDFAVKIVTQVGNYGESFDRNLGPNTPLKIERGLRNWSEPSPVSGGTRHIGSWTSAVPTSRTSPCV